MYKLNKKIPNNLKVSSFPTLVYFSNSNNDEAVYYVGKRT